ncbi:hypothetical protein BH09MYX1_BH09MYX1_49790 [soil metagenome]
MKVRLLVIEEAFASRRDTLVLPKFELAEGTPLNLDVELRLPDGTTRDASITVDVAHIRGDRPPFAMFRFPSTEPAALPRGTEIWAK